MVSVLKSSLRESIFAAAQSVEQLRFIQRQCETLKEEYNKELRALNAKYKLRYDPLYNTRAEVIRGKKDSDRFAVPGFWLKVFVSSATVENIISKADEPILMFEPNSYFSMTQLKKTYVLSDEDDSLLLSSRGCFIDWQPNKNPKYKTVWKRGKQTVVETESFFDFFDPPQLPVSDGSAEIDFEQIHNIQEAIEEDFDIGLVIRDVLIPNAVSWFTGEIAEGTSEEEASSEESDTEEEGLG